MLINFGQKLIETSPLTNSDLCDYAKERCWAPRSKLLLLGQLH